MFSLNIEKCIGYLGLLPSFAVLFAVISLFLLFAIILDCIKLKKAKRLKMEKKRKKTV